MLETAAEIAALQALLDRSMARAGPHLREILTSDVLMPASDIVERMSGMQLLTASTVSGVGRPVSGAVDGYLLHGELWFSSGDRAVRTSHLRRNAAVSATWLPDERTQLIVHGNAEVLPFGDARAAELREAMLEYYVPREGDEWAKYLDDFVAEGAVAFRIAARKVFAYHRDAGIS